MASNSGYQYVGEPGRGLECVICLEVAEDPWQHGQCGRLLCKECLDKLGKDTPCPNCREENPQFFQDNKSELSYIGPCKTLCVPIRQKRYPGPGSEMPE